MINKINHYSIVTSFHMKDIFDKKLFKTFIMQ